MSSAWEIVQKKGYDGLKEEIEYRNITKFYSQMPKQDMNNLVMKVKDKLMDHLMVLAFAALHDEFDFTEEDVQRFWDKVDQGAQYLCCDAATWDDYVASIAEEMGLEIEMR